MKKVFVFAAVAASVLAVGCAKNQIIQNTDDQSAVEFGVYVPQTKAGAAGEMNNTNLEANGFGVFASVSTGDYDGSTKMDFMYNQAVTHLTSWSYTPIKYWPNQIQSGNTDSQPATAFAAHKVSFFAYAPYVSNPASDTSFGITAFTANTATGDPKVTYKVYEDGSHNVDIDKNVDLLWGVYKNTSDADANGTWVNVANENNTTLYAGKPYLNLQKPALNTPIHFYFYHALSQLKLTAQAAYNQVAAGGTKKNDVKITISEVKVTLPGMHTQADLNLNNTTKRVPLWENATGSSDLVLTIAGTNINSNLRDGGPKTAATQETGVTETKTDIITAGKYFTFIPIAGPINATVKITYYVTTDDTNLGGGYSRVENVIQKTVSLASGFVGNTRNNINIVIGLGEVTMKATVEDWTTDDEVEVDLPLNKN